MNNQEIIKKQFYANKISWINSFKEGISLDQNFNAIPWYCYDAIDFLKTNLNSENVIFEFGCGTSTIFYHHKVAKIVSIETNKIWFEIIAKYLIKNDLDLYKSSIGNNFIKFKNTEIYLMEDGITNDDYQNFAKNYSAKNNIYFDFIVVDSIKRYQCAINSINALNDGGSLIIDDSERANYKKIFDFYQEKNSKKNLDKNFAETFEIQHLRGIAPGQLRIKNTSFIKKIRN